MPRTATAVAAGLAASLVVISVLPAVSGAATLEAAEAEPDAYTYYIVLDGGASIGGFGFVGTRAQVSVWNETNGIEGLQRWSDGGGDERLFSLGMSPCTPMAPCLGLVEVDEEVVLPMHTPVPLPPLDR